MLEFFKKKPKPQPEIKQIQISDLNIGTIEIDQLITSPRFEIYKPYMEANKERCELQLKTFKSTKSIMGKIQQIYRSNLIYIIIYNFSTYRQLFGHPSTMWSEFDIFLLELLAREAHITEYPICFNEDDIVDHMGHEPNCNLHNMFTSIRNSYDGTTDKVIMEVMSRLIQQETIKTEHVTYEIQKLIDDPTIPNQYNDFIRYNDQLLCDMYYDCMEHGLLTRMTFFTFIKNVYKCIIIDHIYRVDRKCVNPKDNGDGYEKKYKQVVTSACLHVNPVWFPNDQQTEEIIKRTYEILGYMDNENEEAEKVEEPTDDKSVPDEWLPVKKSWDEFQKTGLILLTNQFLHIFGWALAYERNDGHIIVYPTRVRYRGFDEGTQTRAYEKIQKYMVENAKTIYEESDYDEGE